MSSGEPRAGGILKVALDWEVDRLDPPASFGGWNTGRVAQQVFESLVEDDLSAEGLPYTRLVAALSVAQELSPDGLIYRFFLRQGVRFHDGAPFDAEAAKFNIERIWNPNAPQYSTVAADYNRVAVRCIRDVSIIDTYTLDISLYEPFPEFQRYMTQEDAPGAFVFVSPQALIESGTTENADDVPGTGPFKVKERFQTRSGSGVTLERNPEYWGRAPYLDQLTFVPIPEAEKRAVALERGEVDLAYGVDPLWLDRLRKQGFVISRAEVPYVWYFAFNLREAPFNDIGVRRAIAHAIDRSRICKQLFGEGAHVAKGVMPPASPSFEADFPEFYPYDPDKACALLNSAGYSSGLCVKLLVARAGSGQMDPIAICEQLRKDLSLVGVDVQTEIREDWVAYCDEWHQGMPAGIDASEMSWGMSCDIWLEQVTHSRYIAPTGFNTGYYENNEVDRLLDLARTEQSEERRIDLYQVAHRIIMRDLPILPVLNMGAGLVAHSPQVKGFKDPEQNWHDFKEVWLGQRSS